MIAPAAKSKQPAWLSIKAGADTDPVDIVISGPIGSSWWDDSGTSGKEFRNALNTIPKGRKINLRVNSEGGSVQDGLEMYHAIKERAADVTARIEGYAVSIASVFPLAASRVISPKGSIWMMHDPLSTFRLTGNVDAMRRGKTELDTTIRMLEAHADEMAEIYAAHTGKTKDETRAAMQAETWMTSKEAADFGLADEAPEDEGDMPLAALDCSNFKNVPRYLLTLVSNGRQPQQQTQSTLAVAGAKAQPMNAKLLAIAKKHGVQVDGAWTEDELLSAIQQHETPTPTPSLVVAGVSAADFRAEKRKRVRNEVLRRAENKVANAQLDWWIDRAMEDEDGVYSQLDAMAVIPIGGAPVGGNITILAENPLEKIRKQFPNAGGAQTRIEAAKARKAAMRDAWPELIQDAYARDSRRGNVVAANTYSATLVTAFLEDGAVTLLQNQWASLACYARDFSTDRYKPLATGEVKTVAATDGNVQTNATNFEMGDTTVNPTSIAVNQYTRSFHVTNSELNSGLRMENLVEINMAVFADKVTTVATAPITQANFGTGNASALPSIIRAPGNFQWSDMQTAWGSLKKSPIKNAILDGEYLARIINVPTQFQRTGVMPGKAWAEFGWDNIALGTNWTGADPNVRGFACNPQAIGAASGLPLTPPVIPGATLQESTVTIPGVDITIACYFWFSLASRTAWCSFDVMFGANAMDTTAGLLITSS